MPQWADDRYSRTVWKPSRTGADQADQTEKPLYCGGPNYASLYHEQQQEREERERREAEERERAEREAQAGKARGRPDRQGRQGRQHADDEDDDVAAETEKRNDRYAVTLLRQDDDAWGGGSGRMSNRMSTE
jgi:hypothetical protein